MSKLVSKLKLNSALNHTVVVLTLEACYQIGKSALITLCKCCDYILQKNYHFMKKEVNVFFIIHLSCCFNNLRSFDEGKSFACNLEQN